MAKSNRLVILIKNIYTMKSETLSSTCYTLFDKSNIPFYSTSNGYNNKNQIVHKDRLKVDYSNMGR